MPDFRFDLTCSPSINYALQQNYVPIIKSLVLHNNSAQDILDVELRVTAEPAFLLPYCKTLALLPAGQAVDAGLLELVVSPDFLAGLTERVTGVLTIDLAKDDAVLARETAPLDLLAFDQWGGLGVMPELIAAFVTPNHPGLVPLLRQVSEILGRWTGDPSLNAYQSKDANRARLQLAAVYSVLQSLNITYTEPPASFEAQGQRIRLCGTLLEQHMGTCIDTTLLTVSLLEAMGLHPLVVFTRGHAFAGLWLEDECFPEAVQDDLSAITKRTATGINGICVVETTAAVAGRTVNFESAERLALNTLAQEDDFILAVDIKRARAAAIRPLPERMRSEQGWQIVVESRQIDESLPGLLDAAAKVVDVTHLPPSGKQQQWERRLLDLSLRNTLLSLRMTRNILPLLAANVYELEDALASGEEFQVLGRPQDWASGQRDERIFELAGQADPFRELLHFEFGKKRLRSALSDAELAATMTSLYRAARVSLEENGANTLYLALGLLKWYETPASQKPRYSPLVLIPIEIIRKSALKGYVIRLRDDEPQMNITLLEMLKQDFGLTIGGLDPLPADDNGVDLRHVFSVMRQAVMSMSQWNVLEEAFMGIFSFSQFVMWNDIRNRSKELATSRVVSSLVAGRLTWQPQSVVGCGELDTECAPDKVFLPVVADASQMEAIHAAGLGRSFVLHGPPGTGKSQTITNIIANALANGKSVLFVAEKMAALSVVQRRLEAVGIGSFCLELHSNKSRKKDVLERLRSATEVVRTQSPQDFAAQAQRLAAQREQLNAYVAALHQRHPFGVTLYESISGYGNAEADQAIPCLQEEFASLDAAELDRREDLCQSLIAAARSVGHPSRHPLQAIGLIQYSQGTRTAAVGALDTLIVALGLVLEKLDRLGSLLNLPPLLAQTTVAQALAAAAEAAGRLAGMPAAFVGAADLPSTLPLLQELTSHGRALSAARQAFLTAYRPEALALNGALLLDEWQRAQVQWFLPKWTGQGRVAKALKPYALSGKPDKAQVEGHLRQLAAMQAEQKKVEALIGILRPLLGDRWWEHDTDWNALEAGCVALQEMEEQLNQAVGTAAAAVRRTLAALPAVGEGLRDFALAWRQLEEARRAVAQLLEVDLRQPATQGEDLNASRQKASQWREHLDELREWAAWNKTRSAAFAAGLKPVVDAYEQGMDHGQVLPAYLKGRYQAAAEWIIGQSPVLREFSGAVFEDRVRQFQRADAQFERLTRQEIHARLAAKIPNFTLEAAQSSELGILQRAIRSGGRGQSIRKLFESLPNLLPRLAPCMLMSPISVAQYLDPAHPAFDLVVFDEASQLPTCKAVGAVARARDVIVVGDPMQLPPTSFFATNTSVDEEDYEVEDLESILDDCLALSMPQSSLLWHYRSHHESLIAFSNSNYYDNKLLTFPSPQDIVSRVSHVYVPGSYDRGKTKQNRAEAESVVAEILRRLQDEALRGKSIGVVTFSSVQQNLIEDLLTAEFALRPELEEIAVQGVEPLFIKNLENVQGDERDVILFSVGYGPDKDGRVSLNFGPLNREGGWRRLNVAVSRAREEMIVFSTLLPEQLDAARTTAKGVAGLKAFLEYARSGKRVIAAAQAARQQTEPGIEGAIAQALQAEGYQVHTNIGCSGYRINAVVVHPDKPREYILGILCDGANYRMARTARDRELAQEAVLRQLGWNIRRVWTLDWWDNPQKEARKLAQAIRELLHSDSEPKGPDTPGLPPKSEAASSDVPRDTAGTVAAQQIAHLASVEVSRPYQATLLPQEFLAAEDFNLPQNAGRIAKKIAAVVNDEGPISHSLLCYRVLQSFGISRMGSRVERTLREILARFSFVTTEQEGTLFYWPAHQSPLAVDGFRIGNTDDSRRDAEDLPWQEVACAVREVLRRQIGLPEGDLAREAAKLMGYARLGPTVEQAMQAGIDQSIYWGWTQRDNRGYISIKMH